MQRSGRCRHARRGASRRGAKGCRKLRVDVCGRAVSGSCSAVAMVVLGYRRRYADRSGQAQTGVGRQGRR